MDAAIWGFIGALAGTVVGASASILTTIISGRNSARLQEQAHSLERLERARSFQRNNLLELQDSITEEMRLIGRAHYEDMESYRKSGGSVRTNLLSEELNQELSICSRKIAVLTERIADDTLRDNLKELRQKMMNVLMARSETESRETLQIASTSFEQFMVQLGAVLRSNY